MFANARTSGVWDDAVFSQWLVNADTHDWHQLEGAWQREENPSAFTWSTLKKGVEDYAAMFSAPPLCVFSSFVFSPEIQCTEGDWIHRQEDTVLNDVYRTAQFWMETSTSSLDNQAWQLLRLAIRTNNMPAWRQAPEKCVAEMDWRKGVYELNSCDKDQLSIEDIVRIPTGSPNSSLIDAMLKCYQTNTRVVARCIEQQGGPGLWLQHVLGGSENGMLSRRYTAWQNMQLDGVDAWAMVQYFRPATSFEASLDGVGGYKSVQAYEHWAKQWWVQSALGMDPKQACAMSCHIRSPQPTVDETYAVDGLLSMDSMP